MASPWLCVPWRPWSRWTSLARASSSSCVSRLATLVFAEQHAEIRTFHSYQQQQQQQQQRQQRCGQGFGGGGARKLLTCTAFVSAAGLGYALYNWRDDVRQGIEGLNRSLVPNRSVVHAHPLPSSDGGGQNRDKYNFIADVVEVSASSVVYIEITHNNNIDFFTKKPIISNGSGFIVSQDGLILTNAHVVENKPNITVKVRLYDGSTYTGIIEDVDLKTDLATVRINKTNLPVMKLGCSANIRPGEFVVAIGSPLNLSNTITSGIVSSVNRQSQEIGLLNRRTGYIQTDAAINFGNSGGPLVNLNGEAIGINAMKITPGISFAIPIDDAKEFLKKAELRRKNKNVKLREAPRKRYLGVTMKTLTPEILRELHQNNEYVNVQHGVYLWKVMPGSPAYCAGLIPKDIVTHANNEPVLDSNSIYKILEQPGIIKLQIVRKGQVLSIQVLPENIY